MTCKYACSIVLHCLEIIHCVPIHTKHMYPTADPGGPTGAMAPPPKKKKKPKLYAPPPKTKKKKKKKKGEKERQNKTPQLYAPSLCS